MLLLVAACCRETTQHGKERRWEVSAADLDAVNMPAKKTVCQENGLPRKQPTKCVFFFVNGPRM